MNMLLIDPEIPGAETLLDHAVAQALVRLGPAAAKRVQARPALLEAGRVRIGVLNGARGWGRILNLSDQEIRLEVTLDPDDLPVPAETDLVLAMPRPKQLRRVVHHAVSLGIGRLWIIRAWRVERSYFASPLLDPVALMTEAVHALEQVQSTLLPRIEVHDLFKPFVEDRLPQHLGEGVCGLVAHPEARKDLSTLRSQVQQHRRCVLAIGPERGFTPYEIDSFEDIGMTTIRSGERILRVETAVPTLLGQLQLLRRLTAAQSR